MARLIDADELPITSVGICDAMGNNYGCADVVFADDVKNAPTVDAEPVRRGKWVEFGNDIHHCLECSKCGYLQSIYNKRPKYCPNCGAKFISSNFVDEERENENAGG